MCSLSKTSTQDEEMVVAAFVQVMTTSLFSDLLIRNLAETLSDVGERVAAHIEAEEVVLRKNASSRSKQPMHKENTRDHSSRSNEASTEKGTNLRYVLYVAKKNEPKTKAREETTIRPRFRVPCK